MNNVHQVDGSQLVLLRNGAEYFPRLCEAIGAAQHTVYLETYIFAPDKTGRIVADALQLAASRGVEVRLLLDGFGSAGLHQSWIDGLRTAGVEVQWFRREISPFTLQRNRLRRLRRMHRKMAVMDDEVAFVGGINIIDDIPEADSARSPRLDYAVRVQGAMAAGMGAAMRHLWGLVSWASFRRSGNRFNWRLAAAGKQAAAPGISLVLRDNVRHRRDIERAYLKAIVGAQHEVIIANAYFLPGRVFRRALKNAAQRGIRVLLLLQGKVEYRLQHYATRALYDQLLAAGVEIHEYQTGYLHAKVAVVDGQWATVGSSNIDPFSLLLAREANLAVRDAGFAGELRASLLEAVNNNSIRIGKQHCRPRNWLARLIARISYGIVRFLVGMSGVRGKRELP